MKNENEQNFAQQEYKSVKMPEREIIISKLTKSKLLGTSSQTNRFFYSLADSLSDQELIAPGIAISWALSLSDTLSKYPPMVAAIVDMRFDEVIALITPDKEVAEQTKEFHRETLEQIKKEREEELNSQPKPENLGPEDSLLDQERYTQARKIADLVLGVAKINRKGMGDRRGESANPFYNQTHRGFFLEQYYSSPSSIWTPWGKYGFGGSGIGWNEEERQQVLDSLGAKLYRPAIHSPQGVIGPIYSIHNIDGLELPTPIERPRNAYRSYEHSRDTWRQMEIQYFESQGEKVPLTSSEKFALDDEILKARGEQEPPINDTDIKTLLELSFLRGRAFKYTRDNGQTWHYSKLSVTEAQYIQGGELALRMDNEVMPHIQSHSSQAITDKDFEKGMVARPTTQEETKDIKFSYDFTDENEDED